MLTAESVKLAVIGSKGSGKTALVVRYLTKRFIGEYDSQSDHVYKNYFKSFLLKRNFKLLDASGDFLEKSEYEMNEILEWANGFVIVYDICDRTSFNSSIETINTIRSHYKETKYNSKPPIILIGNKCDLEVGRQVSQMEASLVAQRVKVDFFEVSSADEYKSVKEALDFALYATSKALLSTPPKNLQEIAKLSLISSPFQQFIHSVLAQKNDFTQYKTSSAKLAKIDSLNSLNSNSSSSSSASLFGYFTRSASRKSAKSVKTL